MFKIFILFVVTSTVQSANILAIFPTPSLSHHQVFNIIIKDLLARGHHITQLTPTPPDTDNKNLTVIDYVDYLKYNYTFNFAKVKEDNLDEYYFLDVFLQTFEKFYEKQFEQEDLQPIIKNSEGKTFDLVIVEQLIYLPWFAIARKYNAPLVTIKSSDALPDAHAAMGNVINPIIHPEVSLKLMPPLSFWERWRSLKFYLWNKYYYQPTFNAISEKIVKKYFPDLKVSAEELLMSVQIMLTNAHPVMGFIRPLLPTTIQMGYIHIQKPKPLPTDLQTYLDQSKNGVIYMSLGTNVRSSQLSEVYLNHFRETFRSLKYDVLWKWEKDDFIDKPDNVLISKWFPQADLLGHPKIKLFITQGGQQSIEEAIDRGVPLIVTPFMSDQHVNAKKVVTWKIGVHLDLFDLTEENLKKTIEEVLKPEYKKNALSMRELIHDQPMTSRKKAVWWIEYVIRHNGTKHLDYIGRYIPFYQKYCLDILTIGFLAIVLFLVICFKIMSLLNLKIDKIKNKKIKKS